MPIMLTGDCQCWEIPRLQYHAKRAAALITAIGSTAAAFPTEWYTGMTSLHNLICMSCNLMFALDPDWGSAANGSVWVNSLHYLDLSGNTFIGGIPTEWQALPLEALYVS